MATVVAYTNAFAKLANKEVDWDTNTIKVSLHNATYAPNQNSDAYWSSATNEVTGTGYTSGGTTLTTAAITVTGGATHLVKLTADTATWASITAVSAALKWAVIYLSTGVSGTSPLLGYLDLGSVTPNGAFSITWDATNGILYTTTA